VQVCNLFIELCITEKSLNILYEFLYQLTLNNWTILISFLVNFQSVTLICIRQSSSFFGN